MARMTVEDVYRGDKYNVLDAVGAEFLTKGRPASYSRQTWLELLLVKHALIAAEKMFQEGDSIDCAVGQTLFDYKNYYVQSFSVSFAFIGYN